MKQDDEECQAFLRKLEDTLDHSEENGKALMRIGEKIKYTGQRFVDYSSAVKPLISGFVNRTTIIKLDDAFNAANKSVDVFIIDIENSDYHVVSSSTTLSGVVSVLALLSEDFITYENQSLKDGVIRLNTIISSPEEIENVIELMKNHDLDKAAIGKKTPLELFETAHNAFNKTVDQSNPAITSLIPLRESINSVLAQLRKYQIKKDERGQIEK
jgi:hypothetical protein